MQVEFTLNFYDYVDFNIHLNQRGSTGRWLGIARWVLLGVQTVALVIVFYPQLVSGGIGLLIGLLPIIALAGLWLVVVPFVYRQWFKLQVAKLPEDRRAGLGHHVLTLTTEHIVDRSETSEAITSWHEVEEIASTSSHLFLYSGPASAHIVPRRAFPNADAFEDFAAAAREYRENVPRRRAGTHTLTGEQE